MFGTETTKLNSEGDWEVASSDIGIINTPTTYYTQNYISN